MQHLHSTDIQKRKNIFSYYIINLLKKLESIEKYRKYLTSFCLPKKKITNSVQIEKINKSDDDEPTKVFFGNKKKNVIFTSHMHKKKK